MGAVSASWSNPPHLSHLRQDENFLAFHCSQPCPGFCPGAADPGGNIHRPGVCTTSHPVCPRVWTPGDICLAELRPPGDPVCPGIRTSGHPVRPKLWPSGDPVRSGVRAAGNSGVAAVRKSTSRSNFFCSAERPVHTTGDPVLASDCSDCRQLGVDFKNICLCSKKTKKGVSDSLTRWRYF